MEESNPKIMKLESEEPLLRILLRLWQHLPTRRKHQINVLAILILVSGFAQMLSLGALVPFLGALMTPEKVLDHESISQVAHWLGIKTHKEFILALALVFFGTVVASGAIQLITIWATSKLSHMIACDLETEAYRKSLHQPYPIHVARHSSAIVNGVLRFRHVTAALLSALKIVNGGVIVLFIVTALIFINAPVALACLASLAAIYLVTAYMTRSRLKANGILCAKKSRDRMKMLQESLAGIRDILLESAQPIYVRSFRAANLELHRAHANTQFLGQAPRVLVEAFGIITISTIALVAIMNSSLSAAIPLLGALALGAQRLLPAVQEIYQSWSVLNGSKADLEVAISILDQPIDHSVDSPTAPMIFRRRITLHDVSFRYTADGPWILRNLNLAIPKGARIGLVGVTGSGKSTALDLFMGLLTPTVGEIRVDEQPLMPSNRRSWQKTFAHVPQSIFLADASLAANIAFCVPADQVEKDRVRQAAQRAQIADFIEAAANGYAAMVGERGVRLSGGQRQRIGLARAFYRQASILILDEATSALDSETEQNVVEAIAATDPDVTLLIVSHRPSILETCDAIYTIADGRILETEKSMLEKNSSATIHAT